MKIAVALEGTLSDAGHRFDLKNESFEAYQSAVGGDDPNQKLIEWLNQSSFDIVVYSTTPENLRPTVNDWFFEHGAEVDELLLKKKNDFRTDVEVKIGMIETLDKDGVAVIENSTKVADLLREKGYLVFHV